MLLTIQELSKVTDYELNIFKSITYIPKIIRKKISGNKFQLPLPIYMYTHADIYIYICSPISSPIYNRTSVHHTVENLFSPKSVKVIRETNEV